MNQDILSVLGKFSNNTFTSIEGEKYDCVAYKPVRKILEENEYCFINMIWNNLFKCWVIFQVVPLDKDIMSEG